MNNSIIKSIMQTFQTVHLGFLWVLIIVLFLLFLIYRKHINLVKHILNISCYIIIPLGLTGLSIYTGYFQHVHDKVFELGRSIGYRDLWLFAIIMFAKPLFVFTQNTTSKFKGFMNKFMGFIVSHRRQLGILVFYLALGHAILYISYRATLQESFFEFFALQSTIAGLIAFFFLFVGYITSNNFSIIKLKQRRKRVQMLAYIAFVVSIIHVILIRFETIYVLGPVLLVYGILKFFEYRKK